MKALVKKIDRKIKRSMRKVTKDTISLVNINSIKSEPKPNAPFGEGVKAVHDKIKQMSEKEGFFFKDYGVGVVSVALKDQSIDLGIWIHGDVVEVGAGWTFEPFNAKKYKGCVIGRGATDNKGQAAAVFNLLKVFKDLKIDLKYNPAIFVGGNEETGMADLLGDSNIEGAKGFLNVAKPPKLSLVPDGDFPCDYAGRGSMYLHLKSNKKLSSFTLSSSVDGRAVAEFDGQVDCAFEKCTTKFENGKTQIACQLAPRHGSYKNGSMITFLSKGLLESDLVNDEEKSVLQFILDSSLAIYGENLGIAVQDEKLGRLTNIFKIINTKDGQLELVFNVGYPYCCDKEEIVKKVEEVAKKHDFSLSLIDFRYDAYYHETQTEVMDILINATEKVDGQPQKTFLTDGGTYAHNLPNAYVFGASGNLPPDNFDKDRGGAHGPDEAVRISRLERAMKIYARALLALNDYKW